jgi:multidrug efflux pump subunit AcrB
VRASYDERARWRSVAPDRVQDRCRSRGITEESRKASNAILPLVPIMLALTLLIIILQVRSMSTMAMMFAIAPRSLMVFELGMPRTSHSSFGLE